MTKSNSTEPDKSDSFLDEFPETRTTFYFDGTDRWLRRDWARQCPHKILLSRQCQGVEGHEGEHWSFGADGSYHWSRDKDHPEYKWAACGSSSPDATGYRTPAEMCTHYYMNHHEDHEVTEPAELQRLNQGDFRRDESVNRPCTKEEIEELRALGRLDEVEDRPPPQPSIARQLTAEELAQKSSAADIRNRFDQDVERFSDLETGQAATIDAPLAMELITQAAIACTPTIHRVLDIGCGAGNNSIKLRQAYGRDFEVDLLDLSQPMLERAETRVRTAGATEVRTWQTDFRDSELPSGSFDVILAAAVLHHLRGQTEWLAAFQRMYDLLAPGGSLWITDLVSQETIGVHNLMWQRYGEHLSQLGGDEYRDHVWAYIEQEDSPRPVTYQLDLLRRVGFAHVELLHKNSCFAAFGAVKRT